MSRAGDIARLEQSSHWNRALGEPHVPPGSAEEDRLLARIDELRAEERERLGDTFAARRKRSARHWRGKPR